MIPPKSRLFYVVGASGAGKDTVIDYARNNLPQDSRVVFAHRYITRPADYGAENHIALTEDEFAIRLKNGCFVMNWQSHGFSYGVGIEIVHWLHRGLTTVVSGSRQYFQTASAKFPGIRPIMVTASHDTICKRLVKRGREDIGLIRKRLERNNRFTHMHKEKMHFIQNEGEPQEAGMELLELLHQGVKSNVSNS
jgi:ribose 1,5-bisphosphokinase